MKKRVMLTYLLLGALPLQASGFFSSLGEFIGVKQKPTYQRVITHEGILRGTTNKTIEELEDMLVKKGAHSELSDGTKIPFRALSDGVFILFWKAKGKKRGVVKQVLQHRKTEQGKPRMYKLPAAEEAQHGFRVFYGSPQDPEIGAVLAPKVRH